MTGLEAAQKRAEALARLEEKLTEANRYALGSNMLESSICMLSVFAAMVAVKAWDEVILGAVNDK